ncbi:MAG: HD-GYP domain-containing protein [Chloroflexi bacterium]|nr:HD-GYP domain-containing protein [Chloroflexota bacterium]
MSPSRRPPLPARVTAYVLIVVIATLAVTPFSTFAEGYVRGRVAFADAALLAALIVGAHLRPIRIGPKRRVNVSAAPEMAAVLLLPGPLAVLTLALSTLLGEAHLRRAPIVQRTFNTSAAALRAAAGVSVNAALLTLNLGPATDLLGALTAATVMHAGSTLLVIGIAAVQLRENPLPRAWAAQRQTWATEWALLLTGMMTALATAQQAWALALLAAPAAIAYRALRDGVALQAQTRLALEELADIVDMRDHYTFEHSRRVAELSRATARRLNLPPDEVEQVTMAARVHDVGKIGIKSSVLMKPGKLTDPEWLEMRTHPEVGARLIANFPQFARGKALVLHHHERYDGKGYPRGLAGEQIPFGARILAAADAWDAMTSHRAYRRALDLDHVRGEMHRGSGTQFDPAVVEAFLAVLAERPDLAIPTVNVEQDVDEAPRPDTVTPPEGSPAATESKTAA